MVGLGAGRIQLQILRRRTTLMMMIIMTQRTKRFSSTEEEISSRKGRGECTSTSTAFKGFELTKGHDE